MNSEDLTAKYSVIADHEYGAVFDLSDRIAVLEFKGKDDKIALETAEWAADMIKELGNSYHGLLIRGSGPNFCGGYAIDGDKNPAETVKAFQRLTSAVRYSGIPVVTLLHGEASGIGYDIVLNSHAVIAMPRDVSAGYRIAEMKSIPMGGGLTAQVIDTYAIGDNTPGHDIVPFLKSFMNRICFPKKAEDTRDAIEKGILPKHTQMVREGEDLLEKGKRKALNLYSEGIEPRGKKSITAMGTTGKAALDIMVINMLEGGFISTDMSEIAFKVNGILGGGNVPKGSLVDEGQLLKLEMEAYIDLFEKKSKSSEVEK